MRWWALLGIALFSSACDENANEPCVLDSDCSSFAEACVEGTCRDVRERPDAAISDAGRRDAGRADGGDPRDAGAPDAAMDAAVDDGGPPDASMPCPDFRGTWSIAFTGSDCGTAMLAASVSIALNPDVACEYTFAADPAENGIVGTVGAAADGTVSGMLDPGGLGMRACTGMLNEPTLTLACGGCAINLARE